ncbi:MAG: methyltransferase domain-containing protein, partial [Aureliella sp.]
MHWDSKHYLKFEDERTRPASDLVARIALERPRAIVDLGCGPGNSTAVLRARWPDADITGLDNSSDMLDAARKAHPETKWMLGDAAKWSSSTPIDLVFSNAALQWVSDHRTLMPHLLLQVAADGALAFQIPSATFAAVRTHIHELSKEPAWKQRMTRARAALTMEEPGFYYDCLVPHASRLDIWETEYHH